LTCQRNSNDPSLAPARNWIFRDHFVKLSLSLWNCVAIEDVSQENLCCLNTSVVLLTFARWEGRLQELVHQVKELDRQNLLAKALNSVNNDSTEEYCEIRFRKLLWFWRCYYSCRLMDRKSLEHSSGIQFQEFEKTVSALCSYENEETGSLLTGTKKVHIPYMGTSTTLTVPSTAIFQPWGDF
jgi:Trpc4-associated protein